MLVGVAQDGTVGNDQVRAAASNKDSRVLLAGITEGRWSEINAGAIDFAAVLIELPTLVTPAPSLPPTTAPLLVTPIPTLSATPSSTTERSTTAPSSITTASLELVSPPPSSLPPPSSSSQTPPPAAVIPDPPSTGSAGSSSSPSTATVTGTVAAAVLVVILVLAMWIWRRNTKRQGKGSQFPRSIHTSPNAPYPDADSSTGNSAGTSGSGNPVHGDAPPPDDSVSMPSGSSAVSERRPALNSRHAATVESTKLEASAGRSDSRELASGSDHVMLEKDLAEMTSTVENSVPLSAVGVGLPPYDLTGDQDPRKASKTVTEDVTGSTDNSSSSSSSLHLGICAAEAVMEAASAVARSSNIPGVGETAMLVTLLVKLVIDHNSNDFDVDRRVRWCRSIVSILERASELLGKVRSWN